MEITVSRFRECDIDTVYGIQRAAFRFLFVKYRDEGTSPYLEDKETVLRKYTGEGTTGYLFRCDGTAVGAVRVYTYEDNSARIAALCVLPEYQSRGIAQKALLEIEKLHPGVERWFLDTILEEKGNCHLYEKLGYRRTGETETVNAKMTLVFYKKKSVNSRRQKNHPDKSGLAEAKNMFQRSSWPVLEFDDNPAAKLNPTHFSGNGFDTDKMIITFFPEVIEKLFLTGQIQKSSIIPGENPLIIYRFTDKPDVLVTLGQVGCPACGGNLDLFNAMGIKKAMFCGGGGVLDRSIDVGKILVVDGAIRDEGFSYQYIPASRVIYTDPAVTEKIVEYLEKQEVSFLRGLVWTTDAIFRETSDRIALRKEEGAKIVEMEQAGCIAVAQFRKFAYGALIYSGDDLSGEDWDGRKWRSREGVRYDLVQLCSELVRLI